MNAKKMREMEKIAAKGGTSQWGLIWFRFKKNKLAVIGLIGTHFERRYIQSFVRFYRDVWGSCSWTFLR